MWFIPQAGTCPDQVNVPCALSFGNSNGLRRVHFAGTSTVMLGCRALLFQICHLFITIDVRCGHAQLLKIYEVSNPNKSNICRQDLRTLDCQGKNKTSTTDEKLLQNLGLYTSTTNGMSKIPKIVCVSQWHKVRLDYELSQTQVSKHAQTQLQQTLGVTWLNTVPTQASASA